MMLRKPFKAQPASVEVDPPSNLPGSGSVERPSQRFDSSFRDWGFFFPDLATHPGDFSFVPCDADDAAADDCCDVVGSRWLGVRASCDVCVPHRFTRHGVLPSSFSFLPNLPPLRAVCRRVATTLFFPRSPGVAILHDLGTDKGRQGHTRFPNTTALANLSKVTRVVFFSAKNRESKHSQCVRRAGAGQAAS